MCVVRKQRRRLHVRHNCWCCCCLVLLPLPHGVDGPMWRADELPLRLWPTRRPTADITTKASQGSAERATAYDEFSRKIHLIRVPPGMIRVDAKRAHTDTFLFSTFFQLFEFFRVWQVVRTKIDRFGLLFTKMGRARGAFSLTSWCCQLRRASLVRFPLPPSLPYPLFGYCTRLTCLVLC